MTKGTRGGSIRRSRFSVHPRLLLPVAMAYLLCGCVTYEGIALGPSEFGVEELAETSGSSGPYGSQRPVRELILVGRVSAFREFNAGNVEDYYAAYAAFAARIHPGEAPAYSASDVREQFSGWTKLRYASGHYEDALVPSGLTARVVFPSVVGTFLIQQSGDLVVARSNHDGYFVISGVLCAVGEGYEKCARQYRSGWYDATTGQELSASSLEPVESGHRIDIVDYRLRPD